MKRLGSSGILFAGIFALILGIVLVGGLLDWLIDVTGVLLIVVGIILGVIGLIQMFSGGGKSSRSEY